MLDVFKYFYTTVRLSRAGWKLFFRDLPNVAVEVAHPTRSLPGHSLTVVRHLYICFGRERTSTLYLPEIHYASTTIRHSVSVHGFFPSAATKAGNGYSRDMLQSRRLQRLVISASCRVIYFWCLLTYLIDRYCQAI